MVKEIHTIHWNKIEDTSNLNKDLVKDFDLYVFWPEPFAADVCFKEAGFECFGDTTEKGDEEFEMIIYNFLSCLDKIGDFKIRQRSCKKEFKYGLYGFRKVAQGETTLFEQIEYSIHDNNRDNLIVDFGDKAVLVAGEGHSLFCILTKDSKLIKNILENIGQGRKTKKTSLNWDKILPREFSKQTLI